MDVDHPVLSREASAFSLADEMVFPSAEESIPLPHEEELDISLEGHDLPSPQNSPNSEDETDDVGPTTAIPHLEGEPFVGKEWPNFKDAKDDLFSWAANLGFELRIGQKRNRAHFMIRSLECTRARMPVAREELNPQRCRHRYSVRMNCGYLIKIAGVAEDMPWHIKTIRNHSDRIGEVNGQYVIHNHPLDKRTAKSGRQARALKAEHLAYIRQAVSHKWSVQTTKSVLEEKFPHREFDYKTIYNSLAKERRKVNDRQGQ
ncbi:hypothetical protein BGW42_002319 [Actinomortierella wolfii]|nr:hypothetical protein BGW42_002319 [Actinomortierella wolfii]